VAAGFRRRPITPEAESKQKKSSARKWPGFSVLVGFRAELPRRG